MLLFKACLRSLLCLFFVLKNDMRVVNVCVFVFGFKLPLIFDRLYYLVARVNCLRLKAHVMGQYRFGVRYKLLTIKHDGTAPMRRYIVLLTQIP